MPDPRSLSPSPQSTICNLQSAIHSRRRGAAEADRVAGRLWGGGLPREGYHAVLRLSPRAAAHHALAGGFGVFAAIGWIIGVGLEQRERPLGHIAGHIERAIQIIAEGGHRDGIAAP